MFPEPFFILFAPYSARISRRFLCHELLVHDIRRVKNRQACDGLKLLFKIREVGATQGDSLTAGSLIYPAQVSESEFADEFKRIHLRLDSFNKLEKARSAHIAVWIDGCEYAFNPFSGVVVRSN